MNDRIFNPCGGCPHNGQRTENTKPKVKVILHDHYQGEDYYVMLNTDQMALLDYLYEQNICCCGDLKYETVEEKEWEEI